MEAVARPSRPPGFDMTYRPRDEAFGPPLLQRVPSFLHVAFALAIVTTVLVAERGSHGSELYQYMFMRQHLIDARTLSIIVVVSALASLLRTSMRGVKIRGDSVEFRDVVSNVWPRVRRYRWAQIDRINLLERSITLDLWDGTCQLLPRVNDHEGLAVALERVALARAIPLSGGQGFDDYPESMDYPASEASEEPEEA